MVNGEWGKRPYLANKSVVKFDNLRITGNPATYSQLFYLYGDHLGSTSVITNSAGQLVDRATYLPFGGYRLGDSSILTESGFTSHLHNDSLGLIYMNARFYSPSLNRFISADTIVPDPTNPQSYNRYSYTYNNPIRYTDPTGRIACEVLGVETCTPDGEFANAQSPEKQYDVTAWLAAKMVINANGSEVAHMQAIGAIEPIVPADPMSPNMGTPDFLAAIPEFYELNKGYGR